MLIETTSSSTSSPVQSAAEQQSRPATDTARHRLLVIGGGPAGLTAAYEASRHGVNSLVLEKGALVGGISRTESYKGYRFDMGGHRFFTKSKEVDQMWREVLGEEFLRRPRLSRIYYRRKFFNYPLKPLNALRGLGLINSILILCSYARWRLFPHKVEDSFEQWVTNRFGKRLFETFFKTYTEKVWGISCSELKAEWAAQRIKDLSLRSAVASMFVRPKDTIKTLIESFDYPRFGPGQLWESVREKLRNRGSEVRLGSDVTRIIREGSRIKAIVVSTNGRTQTLGADKFISSMPLTELIKKLDPPPPAEVVQAAHKLKYRDFLTVCLIINKPELFPDNWIYIHDPSVRMGRMQNFGNWSPDMVPDKSTSSLGLEYFCNEGDELWSMSDLQLTELGKRELEAVGLARAADVVDGCVFRVPKSYPVYDDDYTRYLGVIRQYVDGLENICTVGRNGLHRYNNQDHSMLTAIYAVRNLLLGEKHDLWDVNTEMEYHEEVSAETKEAAAAAGRNQRRMSLAEAAALASPAVREQLALVFAKLDKRAVGTAIGSVLGVLLFALTWLAIWHDEQLGLNLLGNFFPAYGVSPVGSVLGLVYGFAIGFVLGYLMAGMRNFVMFLAWAFIVNRAERKLMRRLLEFV